MKKRMIGFAILLSGLMVAAPVAYAATTADSELTQTIDAGALSTSIRDGSGDIVGDPSFAMSAATVSTSSQTVTGTFGSASQRITVDNPGAANNGWTLALNVADPGTEVWTNGTQTYAYNGDATTGQLSVDPSVGTVTPTLGGSTGISLGSPAAFTGSSAISLVTASSGSADFWNGYLTGVGLSQVIPGSQAAGNYTLNLVQTVTTP